RRSVRNAGPASRSRLRVALPRALLPARERIAAGVASELVRGRAIAVGRSAAVRRIVTPVAALPAAALPAAALSPTALSAVSLSPVAAVVLDPVEVVVVVDVDGVVAPPAAAAGAAPEGAHHHAEAERDERGSPRVVGVVDRRIRVNRRAVDDDRVIGRDV